MARSRSGFANGLARSDRLARGDRLARSDGDFAARRGSGFRSRRVSRGNFFFRSSGDSLRVVVRRGGFFLSVRIRSGND